MQYWCGRWLPSSCHSLTLASILKWQQLFLQVTLSWASSSDIRHFVTGKRMKIPDDAHPILKQLIESCWESDPEKRPPFIDINILQEQVKKSTENAWWHDRTVLIPNWKYRHWSLQHHWLKRKLKKSFAFAASYYIWTTTLSVLEHNKHNLIRLLFDSPFFSPQTVIVFLVFFFIYSLQQIEWRK